MNDAHGFGETALAPIGGEISIGRVDSVSRGADARADSKGSSDAPGILPFPGPD